jgi:hypothetical protein
MTIQTTISPDGERLVTMTAEEYQDLIDARDAAAAMREIAAGTMPTVAEAAGISAQTPRSDPDRIVAGGRHFPALPGTA